MDALKLHILFNYYPAIGVVLATLLLGAGLWWRKAAVKRFALKLFVVLAVLTFFVALAGEAASWAADPYGDARSAALTGHKHFARTAFAIIAITGIASFIGLVRTDADPDRRDLFSVVVLILAAASSVLLVTAVLKGRQVKWAVALPTESSILLSSTNTENKQWHA